MFNFTEPVINQYPTGKWGFVGRVPVVLGYKRKDNRPLTQGDVDACVQCGPGLAGLDPVVFDTKEQAQAALEDYQDAVLKQKFAQREG